MTAIIRPIGALRKYIDNQNTVMVESGVTVRHALLALKIPPDVVALVLINEIPKGKDYILADGDVVKIMAVLGGG